MLTHGGSDRTATVKEQKDAPREAVPDMPDRIAAATAMYFGVPVISRDGRIRTSGVQTVW